jgi:hypothetical protein
MKQLNRNGQERGATYRRWSEPTGEAVNVHFGHTCETDPPTPSTSWHFEGNPFVIESVLNLTDPTEQGSRLIASHRVGPQLIGRRRGRRLEEEAAEVAEIDRWLADMRNQPDMVLYPAHPTSATPVHPASEGRARAKKRRR